MLKHAKTEERKPTGASQATIEDLNKYTIKTGNRQHSETTNPVEVDSTDLKDQPGFTEPKTTMESIKEFLSSILGGIKNFLKKDSDTVYTPENKLNKNAFDNARQNPLYKTQKKEHEQAITDPKQESQEKLKNTLETQDPSTPQKDGMGKSTSYVESQQPSVPEEVKQGMAHAVTELNSTLKHNNRTPEPSTKETEEPGKHTQQVLDQQNNKNTKRQV